MIQMTRSEYQQKYGTPANSGQPIKMTSSQYQQKYGEMPKTSQGGYSSDMSTGDYLKGAAGNILPSAGKTLWGLGESVVNAVNPDLSKNTIANMSRLGMGVVQKLDPTQGKIISKATQVLNPATMYDRYTGASTDYQPQAEAVGKFYKDRYGGVDNIKKSLYEDPTGVALDASVVLGGGASLAKGAARLTGSTNAARIATTLGTASKYTNPLTYAGKAAGLAVKPIVPKLTKFLASEAESLPTRGMGNPALLDKAKAISPLTMDELFSKYNTWDRTPEAFQGGIDLAKKQGMLLADTAAQSGSKVDMLKVLDELNANIKNLSSKAKTSDSAASMLEELLRRKKMLVDAIAEKDFTPLKVDPSKITKIKQNFQSDVPSTKFGQPMSELNKASGTTKAYRSLISGIEEAVPGTKNLGREESALIKLKEIARKQEARFGARQNMNFSRLGGAGIGGLVGGIPGAIQGFALEQIANSPQFLKIASKGVRGISNVFSKMGTKTLSIPKASNLNPGERAVEKLFAQDILDNPMAYALKQKNLFGKVLNTDDIRSLSDIYNKNKALSAAVHEPASYLTNLIYEEAVKNPRIKNILFTAGGTGAGKTSALKAFENIKKLVDQADLIYDTNLMNGEKAVSKISGALDRGKAVKVVFTEAQVMDAWKRVIDRAIKSGRTVPSDVHLQTYLKSPEAFQFIREKLGDRIGTHAIRNIGAEASSRKLVDPSSVTKLSINEDAMLSEMNSLVEKYYSEGKITPSQRSGLIGSPQKSTKSPGSYTKRSFGERSNVFKVAAGTRSLNQK